MNGIILMLCADLAFAVMAAATKFTGQRVGAAQIVFVRSAVSSAVLLWMLARNGLSLKAKDPWLLWARGIAGYAALQSYFWAIPQIGLGTAVMLNYTAPIFAVILSFFLLQEKPTLALKLSLLVSFLGVWLLCAPEIPGRQAPLLAALASGFLAGSVHVMIRQSRKSDPVLLIIFYFSAISAAGSGLFLLRAGWTAPTLYEWLGLAVLTVTSFVGQLCLTTSLQKSPVWVVSPFGYLTPVLSLGLGQWFWNETPTAAGLAGSVLVIVCGSVMLGYFRRLKTD